MAVATQPAVGRAIPRAEAREKVTGAARYAAEQPDAEMAYGWIVGASIAAGEVAAVRAEEARALPGVIDVLWHANAPRLQPVEDGELLVLQSPRVAYRGQPVAVVVADSLEAAREAAGRLRVEYAPRPHDAELVPGHPKLYAPEKVNPAYPTDTDVGDFDAGWAAGAERLDARYATPAYHNNPLEPHASTARWEGGDLVVHDSTQGGAPTRAALAEVLGLEPGQVRVIAPHVGGGFGSKGTPRPQLVLAALAARVTGRPVQLAVTRRQMFALVGYRTPTLQRLRLAADADGRLVAVGHEVEEQTSTLREFAEQTATPTRMMYAAPHRRTRHRLAALDVPTPSWMRAPGECPGMFALECAMDELAIACGIDPIELRIRNEPAAHPESGERWTSRNLVACLREGAERFGWASRDPAQGVRREGAWLVGTGVAAATYPAMRRPSRALVRAEADGFLVRTSAADIGTGSRTVLGQIAADALGVPVEAVRVELGDSAFPPGPVAGGSAGTASWGTAVVRACEAFLRQWDEIGRDAPPPPGLEAAADTADEIEAEGDGEKHAFGAHFVEARVHAVTGEVRVPRMLGVFAAGRILNPRTARSQFLGGMTMGISMALHEASVLDARFGDYVNHDLAQYHVAACADVDDMEATWLDEDDRELNPMGSKGIGEIGIVGSAAAVANAVHHACGVRVRALPIQPDKLVGRLP
jgi:xanthine dehydrogenase YagR molybdenum-binding subunit